MKKWFGVLIVLVVVLGIISYLRVSPTVDNPSTNNEETVVVPKLNSLTIEALRQGQYPGSDLVVEETLASGTNYQRQIVSYLSQGNKIYALLTIPNSTKPDYILGININTFKS